MIPRVVRSGGLVPRPSSSIPESDRPVRPPVITDLAVGGDGDPTDPAEVPGIRPDLVAGRRRPRGGRRSRRMRPGSSRRGRRQDCKYPTYESRAATIPAPEATSIMWMELASMRGPG